MDNFLSSVDPYPHDFIGQILSCVMIFIEITFVQQVRGACEERCINRESEYNAKK